LAKHRLLLISIAIALVGLASLPFLMSASCLTRPQLPAEQQALDTLRSMTRNDVLPAEDAVAKLETQFPRTKTAALARLLRARIKLNARDFAGAAALLDTKLIAEHTSLADHALFLRANALEQAGKTAEARAVYQQLIQEYPSSLRAREAALRAADLLAKNGEPAAVPLLLKDLNEQNDAAALLASAKAYEQTGDTTRALASYRRLYFFAPSAAESADATTAIPKLGSALSPANTEEAMARADRLYAAKRFSDAFTAYSDAFAKFPATATPENQLRRGIAASNARKTVEAVSALNSIPTSAGDTRAEALFYLAQTYARARQWEPARATVEEMRRAFPTSNFTPRAFVVVGQIAKEAKNDVDANYFARAAVNSFGSSIEVAQAQFDLAWAAHESRTTPIRTLIIAAGPAIGPREIPNEPGSWRRRERFTKRCRVATTQTGMDTWRNSVSTV
jgi:tetratricopeptide (TPR) repeat protein